MANTEKKARDFPKFLQKQDEILYTFSLPTNLTGGEKCEVVVAEPASLAELYEILNEILESEDHRHIAMFTALEKRNTIKTLAGFSYDEVSQNIGSRLRAAMAHKIWEWLNGVEQAYPLD